MKIVTNNNMNFKGYFAVMNSMLNLHGGENSIRYTPHFLISSEENQGGRV
ncbi:hypothetical protein BMETH_1587_0 [methanotrophic bacterial endosymbiont of Bathymodiolus sp.]|nr:hypothetical protein BMETH_1587_0 [methanotrophic bacterial endosymbiont of Bathymodiolus sp.]